MGYQRRGWQGALAGLGEGIGGVGDAYLQNIFRRENMDHENDLLMKRQQAEMVPKIGELMLTHPELADQLQHGFPGLNLGAFSPSDATLSSGIGKTIAGAQKEENVPTEGGILNSLHTLGRPSLLTPSFGPMPQAKPSVGDMGPAPPDDLAEPPVLPSTSLGPVQNPTINNLMQQRQDRLDALAMQRGIDLKQARANSGAVAGGAIDAKNDPTAVLGDAQRELTMGPVQARNAGLMAGSQFDATHTPERIGASVSLAGREAGARSAAEAPYSAPSIGTDADGNPAAVRFGPTGATPVPLNGFDPTPPEKAKTPQGTQAMDLASLNSAETTGVRVLQSLKKLGLDQSNDPMDPRWNKFIVSTLKVAPDQLAKADIQQRTAYIQAALLRSLMGSRPSNMIADLYKAHTPSGDMSGKLLYDNLNNVLEEVGNKRQELENILHQKPGALDPVSGMTYQQFLKMNPRLQDQTNPALDKLDVLRRGGS